MSVPPSAALRAGIEAQPPEELPRTVDVSVLVPAKDEAENLPLFMEQAEAAFARAAARFEVVVVDDGSVDGTWAVLQGRRQRRPA